MLASVAGTRWTSRFGVPAMLLFVGLGMVAGALDPSIGFADVQIAYNLGTVALAVILLAGGLETHVSTLRAVWLPALLLSTVGVLIKAGVLASVMVLALGWAWPEAMLLGAMLAPTDAAAVFQVLAGKGLRARVAALLEAESGTNDPVSIYLTLSLLAAWSGGAGPSVLSIVAQFALGAGYGWAGGRAIRAFLDRVDTGEPGLAAISVLAGGLATFALANLLGGNGFLAAYVCGMVMADGMLSHRRDMMSFVDGAAWASQIGLFLLLGLLSSASLAFDQLGTAAFVTVVLVFLARPAAVAVALAPLAIQRGRAFSLREGALVTWGGLKGAVPVVLALTPLMAGHPQGQPLFHIVLLVVLMGTALQGTSLVPLARWLGLLDGPTEDAQTEFVVDGRAPRTGGIRHIDLAATHPMVDHALEDLELPHDMLVAAILRGDDMLPARGGTVLRSGDRLVLVLADPTQPLPPGLSSEAPPHSA